MTSVTGFLLWAPYWTSIHDIVCTCMYSQYTGCGPVLQMCIPFYGSLLFNYTFLDHLEPVAGAGLVIQPVQFGRHFFIYSELHHNDLWSLPKWFERPVWFSAEGHTAPKTPVMIFDLFSVKTKSLILPNMPLKSLRFVVFEPSLWCDQPFRNNHPICEHNKQNLYPQHWIGSINASRWHWNTKQCLVMKMQKLSKFSLNSHCQCCFMQSIRQHSFIVLFLLKKMGKLCFIFSFWIKLSKMFHHPVAPSNSFSIFLNDCCAGEQSPHQTTPLGCLCPAFFFSTSSSMTTYQRQPEKLWPKRLLS